MPRTFSGQATGTYGNVPGTSPITAVPITMACFVRHLSAAVGEEIMTLSDGTTSNYCTMFTSGGNPKSLNAYHRTPGGSVSAPCPNNLNAGVWYHVCGVWASLSSRSIYLDGAAKATNTTALSAPPSLGRFDVARTNDAYGFTGDIAHAAIWNVALTDDEVAALAKGFLPTRIRPASLIAYWPIDGVFSPEPDRWRNRYDLSLFGSPIAPQNKTTMPRIYAPTGPRVALPLALPTVPAYISPANGAIDRVAPVTLTWSGTGADFFDVYVWPEGGSLTYRATVAGTSPSWLVSFPLLLGVKYFWGIAARNGAGSVSGPTWSFTMLAAPAVPSGPFPADGAILVPAGTSLSWTAARATAYDVYFGTATSPPIVAENWPFAYYPPPGDDPATTYHWQIVAKNAAGVAVGPVWVFRTAPGGVLVAARIEAQLGQGFRSRLINEAWNVGTWPLAEQARLMARDISGHNYHGTWTGTGFTGGIAFDVPEGCIGTRFNGNGFVNIPNVAGVPIGSNPSLAGGDIDEAILIREYVRDSVKRCLIAKHDGARATGNGWYVAIQNGAIEFSLIVAGSTVFRFTRGDIDSGEHAIVVCYRSAAGDRDARISVDGIVQLPIVSVPSGIEPDFTTAPIRIGHFCDGVAGDGLGIKAALAYASIGREGDANLAPDLQAQRTWTDLTAHVRTAGAIQSRVGIPGNGPADNVATTGTLNFTLDNGYRVPIGYYTPGHPSRRAGWEIGDAIRLSFAFVGITHYEFLGRLSSVTPIAGLHSTRAADCLAVDWMDVPAGTPLSALAAQLGKRSDDVIKAVLDQAQGRSPAGVDIHAGAGTWPFAIEEGESERDTMTTELSRIATSERGFIYVKGDTVRGGLFVYEGHPDRVGAPVRASLDNSMRGLEVQYALDALVNIVRATYTPRTVDAAVVTLFKLDISQKAEPIQPGETRVFEGGYVDPANLAERVGGTQLVPLVAGTDIGFNAAANGSGANMNANLYVVQTLGGNSYRLELQNQAGTVGYLWLNATTGFQIRGKGIYHYRPITIERRDNASVRRRGPRVLEIDLPYESDGAVASVLAAFYLELYGVEQPIPSSLTLAANRNATMMRYALGLQPGDTITLGEPLSGLGVAASRFVVHEKRLEYAAPGILTASFTLAPSPLSLTLRRSLPIETGSA